MPSSILRVASASSSSTFEIAKPTWIRTQSPGPAAAAVLVEQADVDVALDAGDVDPGEPILLVDNLQNLTWDGQAHVRSPPSTPC